MLSSIKPLAALCSVYLAWRIPALFAPFFKALPMICSGFPDYASTGSRIVFLESITQSGVTLIFGKRAWIHLFKFFFIVHTAPVYGLLVFIK